MATWVNFWRSCGIGLVIAGILAIPGLLSLVRTKDLTTENRSLAKLPPRPDSLEDWVVFPRKLDQWFNDHVGMRNKLVSLNNTVRYAMFGQFPTSQVIKGRNGRIFLSAHATTLAPYSAITIPCGQTPTDLEEAAQPIAGLFDWLTAHRLDPRLMIVPSAPVLYPEDLPAWLEDRCAAASLPIPQLLAAKALNREMRNRSFFPLEEMRLLKRDSEVFPKTWFHWAGEGPRSVTASSVSRLWGVDPASGTPLIAQAQTQGSDISNLFPGVQLKSRVLVPEYAQSGVDACVGPSCFPELGTAAGRLQEMAIYTNPRAPAGQLVLLSDSFGQFIAGWYPRYFRKVIHVSTNQLNQLNGEEAKRFRDWLFETASTSHLLFLYHDGSVLWGRPASDLKMLSGT
jgi:hypothetical protein